MNKKDIRVVLAQLNLCVGDINGNKDIIIDAIHQAARQYHADIIIFPELALTAYPPADLLFRSGLYPRVEAALAEIRKAAGKLDVIIGHPVADGGGRRYNSCSLIRGGATAATYHKQILPDYDVFDEQRYFTPGEATVIFDLHGHTVALTVCEDIWQPRPCQQAKAAGAGLIININASPYHSNKATDRQRILSQRAREAGVDIIYLNLVGAQDDLIFDGGSMAVNALGELIFRAPQFEEGLYLFNYSSAPDRCPAIKDGGQYPPLSVTAGIYRALVLGVKDYARKNGFDGVVMGLSGGIDSALTLCIAVDALGAANVEVLLMPSRYTAAMSNEDAQSQARLLGVKFSVIAIDELVAAFSGLLSPYSTSRTDTSEENIQARCRAVLLMGVANKTGKLLLSTSNKSESAVGYATLYGDMAGAFAPLKDVLKTTVFKLANWRNNSQRVIPQRVIDRPPSAELNKDQTDQDLLPPYDLLDGILTRYIELNQSVDEIIDAGFDAGIVRQMVALVDGSEHKRYQAPPGPRISACAFGRGRRYPLTSAYEEL